MGAGGKGAGGKVRKKDSDLASGHPAASAASLPRGLLADSKRRPSSDWETTLKTISNRARGSLLASIGALVLIGNVHAQSPARNGAEANWAAPGGAADESSFSQLDQINANTIARLGLAWSLDLPGEVTLEATPLAVDGVLYFTGSYAAVYAVDAASGKLLWKYDPQTWKHNPMKMHFSFGANRGVAYENGKVFVAALDGRLIALDAKTGKEIWVAQSVPEGMLNISTGAPRTMNGKVIIGNGGADFGARGFVTAFDANSGKQLWRFFTVPGSPEQNKGDPAMEAAAKTWTGEWWKTGTGGTVWNGMTFDPELNRVYIGVGNAGPYDPSIRSPGGGDNLYTSVDRRARCEYRQIRLALPGNPARRLGLQGDAEHRRGDADSRGQAAQGAAAHADERLLLCARPRDRQADLGREDDARHLGQGHRPEDGPADRGTEHSLRDR